MRSTFATLGFIGFLLAGMSHSLLYLGVQPQMPFIVIYGCGVAIAGASALTLMLMFMGRRAE